jgi:hypothetical protein
VIDKANAICEEYVSQGLVLTLRQLYYQFVARGLLPNKQTEYDRLGEILSAARLAGEMDWDYMIDRTRSRVERSHWDNPGTLLEAVTKQYHTDLWANQTVRPIVFVEKDAAIGVVEGVCRDNDVPYFSCRGYTSTSALWEVAQKIRWDIETGSRVLILHVGDHDPSGLDMTRDITERIQKFLWKDWSLTQGAHLPRPLTIADIKQHMREYMHAVKPRAHGPAEIRQPFVVKRIALNLDQVEEYDPPPNPAKQSDARYRRYVEETGLDESWELDALDPNVLIGLIQHEIDLVRDDEKWGEAHEAMERERITLSKITKHFTPVVDFVNGLK